MSKSRLILYLAVTLLLVIHTGDVIASSAELWRKIVLAFGTVGLVLGLVVMARESAGP